MQADCCRSDGTRGPRIPCSHASMDPGSLAAMHPWIDRCCPRSIQSISQFPVGQEETVSPEWPRPRRFSSITATSVIQLATRRAREKSPSSLVVGTLCCSSTGQTRVGPKRIQPFGARAPVEGTYRDLSLVTLSGYLTVPFPALPVAQSPMNIRAVVVEPLRFVHPPLSFQEGTGCMYLQ
jgi:hypothetical protein